MNKPLQKSDCKTCGANYTGKGKEQTVTCTGYVQANKPTSVYVCLLGPEFSPEACAQWRQGSFCANTGGECKHRVKPRSVPANEGVDQPTAPSADISYPMTNGELTDAIVRLGNMPTGSGYCSTWIAKKIADQIKFLLKVQRGRALMLETQMCDPAV